MTQETINPTPAPAQPPKVRTPPKTLATQRTAKFSKVLDAYANRLRGHGVDGQLKTMLDMLTQISGHVAQLADDFKPKKSGGAGRLFGTDKVYAIKPKYVARYDAVVGAGLGAMCIFVRDIDEKTALCTFATATGEIHTQVAKNHIAKEIT